MGEHRRKKTVPTRPPSPLMTRRRRWKLVGIGLCLLAIIALTRGFRTTPKRFSCQRLAGDQPTCTFDVDGALRQFPPGSITSLELVTRSGSKSSRYYAVSALDRLGRQTDVMTFENRGDATIERDRLARYLAAPEYPTFVHVHDPGILGTVMLVLFGLGGVGCVIGGLVSREEVAVPSPTLPEARCSLRNWRWPTVNLRLVLLMVAGLGLYGLFGVVFLEGALDPSTGRLTIRAKSRCQFGGMDLFPGAETSMPIASGDYTLRIYNPAVPGFWENYPFHVNPGQTLTVTCRPTASATP